MTDDPAPGTGANDDGRTDNESADSGADLEAENRELRSRVEELEAMLDDMQDELADVKRATGTGDGGVEAPDASDATGAAPELLTSGGQPTKVIGKETKDDGIGVWGEATGSGNTYGLYTPGDANITGTLETADIDTTGSIFKLTTGATGNGSPSNVLLGHQNNAVLGVGGAVAGGGYDDGGSEYNGGLGDFVAIGGGRNNYLTDDYCTIVGGRDNTIDASSGTRPYATILGGLNNTVEEAYGLAAGRNATAQHAGSMAFGDSTSTAVTTDRADQVKFQGDMTAVGGVSTDSNVEAAGDVAADGVVRANANASDNVSYLRYRDDTASNGPRTFHNNSGDYIAVRGATYLDCDMDLRVNRDQTDQRTSGPIAKGYIDGGTSPSVVNGVNINSVSWNSGYYEVDIAGVSTYDFGRYAVNVSQRVNGTPLASRTHFANDNLTVRFENDSAESFHLVVWELPDGTLTNSTNDTTADDELASSTDDEITSPDAEPEGS